MALCEGCSDLCAETVQLSLSCVGSAWNSADAAALTASVIAPFVDDDDRGGGGGGVDKKIIEIMENAVKLKIPNKVDYESGDNWGEING